MNNIAYTFSEASANMKTSTSAEMAKRMSKFGGLEIFLNFKKNVSLLR